MTNQAWISKMARILSEHLTTRNTRDTTSEGWNYKQDLAVGQGLPGKSLGLCQGQESSIPSGPWKAIQRSEKHGPWVSRFEEQ